MGRKKRITSQESHMPHVTGHRGSCKSQLRRPLKTYSKRHAKRLRREDLSSSFSDLDDDSDEEYSKFRRPLKRWCPSSATVVAPKSADRSFIENEPAHLDLSSSSCSSFAFSNTLSEPESLLFEKLPSVGNEPNADAVHTSIGNFNVSISEFAHQETSANADAVHTSIGSFNVSVSEFAHQKTSANTAGLRADACERETVQNSSGIFDVCRVAAIEENSCASSGVSILDLSDVFTISDISSSEINVPNQAPSSNTDGITFTISHEKLRKFKKELHVFCVENNLSHRAINNLLKLLNSLPPFSMLPKNLALPKDARTLLKSIRKVDVTDLGDGEKYVHVGLEQLLRLYYVSVSPVDSFNVFIGIDAVPISESSHGHFTPVMCAVIPDDPDERSYVSAIGIWYADKTKSADMNKVLTPRIEEAKTVLKDGVFIDGKRIPVKLCGLTFDAVAKSELLGIKGHGGYYACPRCKIRGVSDGGIHFPGVEDHPPRTHDEFLPGHLQYLKDTRSKDDHRLRDTILVQLPGVDLVKDVSLDYMHILCVGCIKYLLKLIATGPRSSFRLPPEDVEKVNERHEAIRRSLPREFARTMKTISLHHKWKATQGRQFILYTGIVTLYGVLPDNQYENLILLHAGAFILLHPVLNKKERYLNKARSFFKQFILTFTEIYGVNHTTYNIHMLQHLPDDVLRFKNLNKSSAWQFENFLGKLVNLLRSGNLPLSQTVKRLNEKAFAAQVRKELEENLEECYGEAKVSFSQEHENGPTVKGLANPQYRLATFRRKSSSYEFALCASDKVKDNCCFIEGKEIILIRNFATSTTGEKCIIFQKFQNKDDFYVTPIRSSKLGIYEVSGLSPAMECAPISVICNKCALVKSTGETFVAIPLLHSS